MGESPSRVLFRCRAGFCYAPRQIAGPGHGPDRRRHGGQLTFAAYRRAGRWRGLHSAEATTHGVYLPTVSGNLISAITLGVLGYADWGLLFFGAGVFSWLSLEGVILHRLRTLGILPPPLVACEACLFVNGGAPLRPDSFRLRPLAARLHVPPAALDLRGAVFGFVLGLLLRHLRSGLSSLHFHAGLPESVVGGLDLPIFIFANVCIGLLLAGERSAPFLLAGSLHP